jgi:hypothetical protein
MANVPSNWQVVLRSAAGEVTTATEPPLRKYLWTRRISRRAYNRHMSRMRQTAAEGAIPAILIFSGLIGLAICLSIFMP